PPVDGSGSSGATVTAPGDSAGEATYSRSPYGIALVAMDGREDLPAAGREYVSEGEDRLAEGRVVLGWYGEVPVADQAAEPGSLRRRGDRVGQGWIGAFDEPHRAEVGQPGGAPGHVGQEPGHDPRQLVAGVAGEEPRQLVQITPRLD